MDNAAIADLLSHYGKLLELHGENSFKTNAYTQAPFSFKKLPVSLAALSSEEIHSIPLLGKSLAAKVTEIVQTGSFKAYHDLLEKTPDGIVEMMSIRGLGPKKIRVLWQELAIQSLGELMYACLENRLLDLKGFGPKSQAAILEELQYKELTKSKILYARIESTANELLLLLRKSSAVERAELTGEFRRQCEIVSSLEYVLVCNHLESIVTILSGMGLTIDAFTHELIKTDLRPGFPLILHLANNDTFASIWLKTSASLAHLEAMKEIPAFASSEEEIYFKNGLYFIPPYLREGRAEIEKASKNSFEIPVQFRDLRGAIHNHSNWSDGRHSIREMAEFSIEQGWEYLVMCDHSKTAAYAGGLSEERVLKQMEEIDTLNVELAPFKIFKGIESDILLDGSLDYTIEILSQFDLVVASVHSQLRMSEDKAMERLLKAIENPYTTILGHPTGRLLLSREGYPLDMKRIIDACAANNVVLELNANPNRLDLDWRFLDYAIQKGCLLSINPDAHKKESLLDMQYGVYVAQKAQIMKENVLNTKNLEAFSAFLNQLKSVKGI
jgi:DNA polymerase (family 10)